MGAILVASQKLSREQLNLGLEVQKAQRNDDAGESQASRKVRVDVDKLDMLGNLVGELVIAENMVTHCTGLGETDDSELRKSTGLFGSSDPRYPGSGHESAHDPPGGYPAEDAAGGAGCLAQVGKKRSMS